MIDVGEMSTTPDRTELKEVYFLRTFWDVVGSHCLQARTVGGPRKDCADIELVAAYECEDA